SARFRRSAASRTELGHSGRLPNGARPGRSGLGRHRRGHGAAGIVGPGRNHSATGGTRVAASERRTAPETYDALVTELRELREQVGQPSYAEVARRIAAHRIDNGVEEFAAMPARTTVYDAFRLGRSRMDPVLISEIARALGESEEDATR